MARDVCARSRPVRGAPARELTARRGRSKVVVLSMPPGRPRPATGPSTSRTIPAAFAAAALLLAAAPAAAQTVIGPTKCTTCHDHDRQATRWQREEPALYKDKAHYSTRKQLEAPKAAAYAKAIGLADPYDVKGSCVVCHATVFRGDANAGVSCESCHG